MAIISEIVDISIDRQTQAVQQAGFGIAMFLGLHKVFNDRSRVYLQAADLLEDGFSSVSVEYTFASNYFGQDVSPESLIIGRQNASDTQTLICSAGELGDVFTFSSQVGFAPEETFNYVSSASETAATVATGLTAEINASGTLALTADDSANDGTIVLTPDVALTPYTAIHTANISLSVTSVETLTDAVTEVLQDNSVWYGLASYTHNAADISELAAWTESNKRIYGYSTANTDDQSTSAIGIMATLQATAYDRTFGLWGADAGVDQNDADNYSEGAWMGDRFPSNPGSSTWMFKTLNGIPVDKLSATQSSNIRSYNGNTYETIAGVNMTREGKVSSGEYIDVIRGIDWLEARMAERIFSRLVNLPKIPFTDTGVAIIEAEVRAQLQEAIAQGVLNGDAGFTITVPKVSEVSATDKANRILPPITFEATLAGAIHKVIVRGTVTV